MSLEMSYGGQDVAWLEALYRRWLRDPDSVDARWSGVFEAMDGGGRSSPWPGPPRPARRSIFAGPEASPGAGAGHIETARRQARVDRLVNAYRVRGHMLADLDPLGRLERHEHPELTIEGWGLSEADLDVPVAGHFLHGIPDVTTPREILARLKQVYSGSIGAEFMNIQDPVQKAWVIEQMETLPERIALLREEELWILRKLSDAEGFERFLNARFPGSKRFSLEGGETLIPLVEVLLDEAAASGVREAVIGMAHRGRLNVLANVLEKPLRTMVDEFEDVHGQAQGSGDVKYHLGFSAEVRTRRGHPIHLSLAFNPSHLEAVDPVVLGRVRAKVDATGPGSEALILPLLLHGDAAFAGQGLVAEILNLSELRGYRAGGTVHVIVNNQIGFTTPPYEARSTQYATDVARMLAVPIFHVNGEDPEAVVAVARVAVAWRQRFHRDVVIDMYCYRKHGHNEGDEPAFTQPLLYEAIRKKPSPREVYAERMAATGRISMDDADGIFRERHERLLRELVEGGAGEPERPPSALRLLWERYGGGSIDDETDTTFPLERLSDLLVRANTLPRGFHAHRKILRLLGRRLRMARGELPVDWAVGEQAAMATLLVQGHPVRLSGQDSGRGTFSHRHAVLADVTDGHEIYPLEHLDRGQAPFRVVDSPLQEAGVLGFEFGYSLDRPDALVAWEAQFGDFANGAQVIVDQFITSSLQKWSRRSGLVLLLPHGYEGQGPDHSSARPERFLLAAAEGNIQVANCTTPANLFHLLRRQVLRTVRRPLVLLAPKSLLRHPRAVSGIEELAEGAFRRVIGEGPGIDPAKVRRVLLCSGKVYYDLLARRDELGEGRVALVRLELLYPFPRDQLSAELRRYPAGAEVVWCQEEPRNMGPWPVLADCVGGCLPDGRRPRYVGRPPAASPATGSYSEFKHEQQALVEDALAIERS